MLAIHHEQEQHKMTNIYYINYRQEYKDILQEKIFVIDDGDHSTMLFAYEYWQEEQKKWQTRNNPQKENLEKH